MPGLDANMEMDPSDISDMDDKAPLSNEQPDAAASSPALKDETDGDLLSIARDVISKEREKSVPASSADGVNTDLDSGSDEAKKPDDEEYTDVPFHKHARFQSLLRKSKAFEQDAGRYHNVQTFLQNNGIDDGEAAEALVVAGLAKTNPAEAWQRIKPWVQKILVAAGEVLPDDLRQRVQSGEMSHDIATEISRTRAAQQSMTTSRQFEESRRATMERSQAIRELQGAAAAWEQDRMIKDPNYADKETAIRKEVLFLQREEGMPNTPQGVRAQLKKAYDAVNSTFRAPPVQASRPAVKPVVGGQVSGDQRSNKPRTTMDIIRAARG